MPRAEPSIRLVERPDHLRGMALYKINSGSREQEVVKLRWDWEIAIPERYTIVFLIPADFGGRHESSRVKNGDGRLVVLNNVAKSVIEGLRELDPAWVFPYGQPDRNGKATPVEFYPFAGPTVQDVSASRCTRTEEISNSSTSAS